MGCLGNSKTEDQRNEEKAQREANKKIEKQLQKDKQVYRATHRLLLLGKGGAGGAGPARLGSPSGRPAGRARRARPPPGARAPARGLCLWGRGRKGDPGAQNRRAGLKMGSETWRGGRGSPFPAGSRSFLLSALPPRSLLFPRGLHDAGDLGACWEGGGGAPPGSGDCDKTRVSGTGNGVAGRRRGTRLRGVWDLFGEGRGEGKRGQKGRGRGGGAAVA